MKTLWPKNIISWIAIASCIYLAGCGASSNTTIGTSGGTGMAGKPATTAYMLNPEFSSLVELPITPGVGTPTEGALTLPPSYGTWGGFRTDAQGNLYIPTRGSDIAACQILVFPPNSSGAVTPLRVIEVTSDLTDLAVDPAGQVLYVLTASVGNIPSSITAYSALGNGPATPLQMTLRETSTLPPSRLPTTTAS